MELTGIAREDFAAKGLICNNEVKITYFFEESNGIPDVYGSMIGRKDLKTGKLESLWKKDRENNNTEELEKILKNSTSVFEKHRSLRNFDTMESREVIDYFIPYDIQESTKNRPTVVENYVIGCSNGSWDCEYELLFTCGDSTTRRLILKHRTVNMGMIDLLYDLEDGVEEAFDDDTDTDFEGVFKYDKDCNVHSIIMFDELGEPCDIEIESASDLLNMIVSVRCIKCDFIEEERE